MSGIAIATTGITTWPAAPAAGTGDDPVMGDSATATADLVTDGPATAMGVLVMDGPVMVDPATDGLAMVGQGMNRWPRAVATRWFGRLAI